MAAINRRHDVVLIGCNQAGVQLALAPFPGNDRRGTVSLGQCPFAYIQTQIGFARLFIWSMAGKTVSRQNRANIPVVIHRLRIRRLAKRKKRQTKSPTKKLLQKKTHVLRENLSSMSLSFQPFRLIYLTHFHSRFAFPPLNIIALNERLFKAQRGI